MRIVSIVLVTLTLALAPAVRAAEPGQPTQVVRGQVLVPMPEYVGTVRTVACALSDAMTGIVAGRQQGMFRYLITVDRSTRGRPFVLAADNLADLDIRFWTGESVSFTSKGAVDERGVVPQGAQYAEVCLDSGLPTAFTYTAG